MKRLISVYQHYLTTLLFTAGCFVCYGEIPAYEILSQNVPESEYGKISRLSVTSSHLGSDVTVDIWLPEGYSEFSETAYPIIYFHDGQNLFDPAFTFAGVAWEVDKACSQLNTEPDFSMPIIVGINNRGAEGLRPSDYFPEKALEYIASEDYNQTSIFTTCNNNFLGDEEAAFVVRELKPLIDTLYNTNPNQSHTFAAGSSMGALASLYLLMEYPDVFGGAACLSTHWIGSLDLNPDYSMNDDEVCANAILDYFHDNLTSTDNHRLYLDCGTEGWDAGYIKYETKAREIVRSKGYDESLNNFSVFDARGAGHNEWFWQQRIDRPLRFLLSSTALNAGVPSQETIPSETTHQIFDLSGKLIYKTTHDSLSPGFYISMGKKFVVTH